MGLEKKIRNYHLGLGFGAGDELVDVENKEIQMRHEMEVRVMLRVYLEVRKTE